PNASASANARATRSRPCPYPSALTTAMTRDAGASVRTRARLRRSASRWIVAQAERIRDGSRFGIRDSGLEESVVASRPLATGARRDSRIPSRATRRSVGVAARVGIRREALELRVLAEERGLDHAGRAVALLADDDLGGALFRRFRVVVFVAIDEQDHVRIL